MDDKRREQAEEALLSGPPVETTGEKLRDSASTLAHRGVEEGRRVAESARERAHTEATGALDRIGEELHEVGVELDELGDRPDGNRIARQVSAVVRRMTDHLDSTSSEELIKEAKRRVRRRPGWTAAACLVIGFMAGRLIKE